MVLAYHAIFAAYGFWLPNDQRGSWSTQVWAPHLNRFGPATKTTERRSLAHKPFDRALRKEARNSLLYPAVRFTEAQRDAIAQGFALIIPLIDLKLVACAIMPDHTHIVALRHRLPIEEVVAYMKRAATRKLTEHNLHPLQPYRNNRRRTPTPWVEGGWNRYLNSHDEIVDAIDYVERNPIRIGLPRQRHDFMQALPV